VAAAAFLWAFPDAFRPLFALTIVPGALAVAMLAFVPETPGPAAGVTEGQGAGAVAAPEAAHAGRREAKSPSDAAALRRFLVILLIFTLGNSTDAFLLLRLADAGLAAAWLPLAWAGLHVVKSSLATLGGSLSDRFGRVRLIGGGWLLYAVVYAGIAASDALAPLMAWFFTYGVYFALVEGSEKALVADLTPPGRQGTAFGWYNAILGLGTLAASLVFGALWQAFGPRAAFLTGAALAVTAAALLAADRSLASPWRSSPPRRPGSTAG
jgi:MFS family permease